MSIFWIIIGILVLIFLLGTWRTYNMEHGQLQELFQKGTANTVGLDGDYTGVAYGYEGSWQGKTLDADGKSGINRFVKNGVASNNYPFTFFTRKGLRDKNLDVIVLDYNKKSNPWWLRYIVDEVVEVGPQKYLGKVHVKLPLGIVFTLGYFSLSK